MIPLLRYSNLAIVFIFLFHLELEALPLFKVEKDGTVSYVMGTRHDLPASHVIEKIMPLLKNSRAVLTERMPGDPVAPNDPNFFDTVPGRDNKQLISTSDWSKLKRNFRLLGGLEPDRWRKLSPPAALMIIEMMWGELEHRQGGVDDGSFSYVNPEQPMDEAIRDMAVHLGIERKILDPIDSNQLLDSKITDAGLRRYLGKILRASARAKTVDAETHEDFLNWTPSDIGHPRYAEDKNQLLNPSLDASYRRHTEWFPTLIEELKRGNVLIAVGALHVIGIPDDPIATPSILDHLKSQGYRVTFVDCEALLSGT